MRPHARTAAFAALLAAGTAVVLHSACMNLPAAFHCTRDDQCVLGGKQGRCESPGYCSLPDEECTATGRRFSEYAGGGLGGACIEAGDMAVAPVCGGLGQECCATGTPCASALHACQMGVCKAAGCVEQLASFGDHTCALRIDGTVWCWGDNSYGQLGDGTATSRSDVVQVLVAAGGAPLTGIDLIASGSGFACARKKSTKGLVCWGHNGDGQLGNKATGQDSLVPVEVINGGTMAPFTGVGTVHAGEAHICAHRGSDDTGWCWGAGTAGQLGRNTRTSSGVPVQVLSQSVPSNIPFHNIGELGVGTSHTCARKTDGTVWCWGSNAGGELGVAAPAESLLPLQVASLAGVDLIDAGAHHTCARIAASGEIWCWGVGTKGELGDGSGQSSATPVKVTGLTGTFTELTLGALHSCALRQDGTVWCWGDNTNGQLGDGTTMQRNVPVQVLASAGGSPIAGIKGISAGINHNCAFDQDGKVWCWGGNEHRQLCNVAAGTTDSPVPIPAAMNCQ